MFDVSVCHSVASDSSQTLRGLLLLVEGLAESGVHADGIRLLGESVPEVGVGGAQSERAAGVGRVLLEGSLAEVAGGRGPAGEILPGVVDVEGEGVEAGFGGRVRAGIGHGVVDGAPAAGSQGVGHHHALGHSGDVAVHGGVLVVVVLGEVLLLLGVVRLLREREVGPGLLGFGADCGRRIVR